MPDTGPASVPNGPPADATRQVAQISSLLHSLDEAAAEGGLSESQSRANAHENKLVLARLGIASGLHTALRTKHSPTASHCLRVALGCSSWAASMELDGPTRDALEVAALLHDVGKIGVPDAVLLKPGRLTAEEFRIIQQHPIIGDRLCGNLRALHHVRPIVRHHHERLDGTGYPDGLRGDAIPLLAQIVSVVDVYDALTTRRPYKAAWSADQALEELRAEARRGWRQASLVETLDAALTTTAYAAPPANELRHSAISRSAVERA
jgi:HD-GYP domain-containing protein (c-di-GMP phosphodiesterase class II)